MSITLWMGRHGETKLNSEECLRGWIDVPLNPDGVKEAHAMAALMADKPIDRIYCSDLDRADHTAQIVAKKHDIEPSPRMWFRPLDYGDLNGKKLTEIQPTLDKLNEIWKTDPQHEAPNGESFKSFQDRNIGGLHTIMRHAKDGEQIMIVAHLRNCLLFHAVAVIGGPVQSDSMEMMAGKDWHQESGSVSQFEFDGGTLKFVGLLSGQKAAA